MDMKYDSSVMHRLTDATEQRMVDAYNLLSSTLQIAKEINTSEWDDSKRIEFETAMESINNSFIASVNNMQCYLDGLRRRMAEFENRG